MGVTLSSPAAEAPTRAIALLALASFASAANLRVCDLLLAQMASAAVATSGVNLPSRLTPAGWRRVPIARGSRCADAGRSTPP